jgi:hypothetical protein
MKNIWAAIGVIAVILVAAGAFWLLSVPPASAAVLYIDEGTVEVDLGQGWVQGSDEMELSQGAKVRTGEGSASVILLAGEVLHLEPNTEVALSEIGKDKMHIKQFAGETWHKITKISGITSYEVETPNTVATVRGTEFYVKMGEEDEIAVGEGEVEVGFAKAPSKKLVMGAMRRMKMRHQFDEMVEEELLDDPRLGKFREKYVRHLKRMRMHEIKKNGQLVRMAQKRYGFDDEKMKQFLDEVDEGRRDEDAMYKQVPGALKKKAERAYKITKAIKRAKRMMQQP